MSLPPPLLSSPSPSPHFPASMSALSAIPQPQLQSQPLPLPRPSPPVSPRDNIGNNNNNYNNSYSSASNNVYRAPPFNTSDSITSQSASFIRRSSSSSSHSLSSSKQKSSARNLPVLASTNSFSSDAAKRESMVDIQITEPKDGEYLVCYFEDGSFSTIPESDAMPFNPSLPPYTTYLNGSDGRRFKEDNAVRLATQYWEKGIPPASFGWLQGIMPLSLPIGATIVSTKGDAVVAAGVGTFGVSKKSRSQHHSDSTSTKKGSTSRNSEQQLHQQSNSKKSKRDNLSGIDGSATAIGDSKNRKISPATASTNISSNSRSKSNTSSELSNRKIAASLQTADLSSEKQRDSSSAELSPSLSHNQKAPGSSSLQGSIKRNSKADIGLGINKYIASHSSASPLNVVPQQTYRTRNGQQPLPLQQQQQQFGSQIIVGSNFSILLCSLCGKTGGTCNCSANQQQQQNLHFNSSNGIQFHGQPPGQQQQQTLYQLPNKYLHNANIDQQIVLQNHQKRAFLGQSSDKHIQTAPTAPPAAAPTGGSGAGPVANPFAPICVLKRSERPDLLMLAGLLPVSRRKVVDKNLKNIGEFGGGVGGGSKFVVMDVVTGDAS
ncbi:hypothetical protein HK100_007587 [Physocladia obscura]|uniref:Uncharacterized protein n=1 Tax=Physocladia obscura TaxID=109957 RepID=A0AAD5T4J7_9FUNG|nr:hypothetical protein HK100_007587 [Physocladia obscura]